MRKILIVFLCLLMVSGVVSAQILNPKDYTAPEKQVKSLTDQEKTDIKNEIKAFVVVPKYYDEIIVKVQKTHNLTNDEIFPLIEEVRKEWHPPVKEIEEEIIP